MNVVRSEPLAHEVAAGTLGRHEVEVADDIREPAENLFRVRRPLVARAQSRFDVADERPREEASEGSEKRGRRVALN